MIDIKEISIEEFKKDIYDEYTSLFSKEEQREWKKIRRTYKNELEKFYVITLDGVQIGFFLLERIGDNPYYLEYYAIYEEYQDKGYGTKALKKLLKDIVKNQGLIGEIEKIVKSDDITKRRFEFYENLGFEKIKSEYLLYDVLYNPIVYFKDSKLDKETADEIFFEYYKTNIGLKDMELNCKIVK